MAFTQEEAAKVAMSIKNAQPGIDDASLAALVKEAEGLNDDPIKSQAFAMKILPQLNTQLADPYAGAGYTSADSMKQFDPAQMRDAITRYNTLNQQQGTSRYMANLGASMGDANGRAAVNDLLKNADALNLMNSVGGQEKLQGQATAGINAAKGVQDMAQTAGKYAGTQLEQQQKLQGSQFTLDQTKRMNDPNSNETALAKSLILSQVGSMDNVSKAEMQKVISQPGVTAAQLLPAMAQWAPAAQKAFMEKVNAGKTVADTGKVYAETPGVVAESRVKTGVANTIVPEPDVIPADVTFNFKPGTDLRATRAVLARSEQPEVLAAFDKQFPGAAEGKAVLKMPAGSNMSVSAGGATIAPSPLTTGAQTAGASEDATGRNQSAVSTKYGLESLTGSLAKQSADAVKAGKASATGSIANWMANLTPGESERVRTDINKLVDAKIAYGTAAGSNPIKDRDAEVARIMKLSPNAFQNEVLNSNQEVARNEARQKAYTDYIQKNGSPTGFDDSKIKGATYMYNPSTGANALVNPAKVDQYRRQGFLQLNELNR